MNNYNFNDESFKNNPIYQRFITENPSQGYLKIRAYTASQAVPISNLKVTVSKMIDNNNITFFEGNTNSSGIIEKIILPAPKLDPNNLDTPNGITYDITATNPSDNISTTYKVTIYENIYVIQTINVVPDLNVSAGDNEWL